GEVARRRMTSHAAALAFEIGLAFFGVAGEKFFKGIVGRDARRLDGFFGAGVQKDCYIADLFRAERQSRHTLVGAAVANHLSNQVAFDVVSHQGGTDQIRSAGSGCVRTVAKPASRLKLGAAAIDGGALLGGRLWRALSLGAEGERSEQKCGADGQSKQ